MVDNPVDVAFNLTAFRCSEGNFRFLVCEIETIGSNAKVNPLSDLRMESVPIREDGNAPPTQRNPHGAVILIAKLPPTVAQA